MTKIKITRYILVHSQIKTLLMLLKEDKKHVLFRKFYKHNFYFMDNAKIINMHVWKQDIANRVVVFLNKWKSHKVNVVISNDIQNRK